MYKQFIDTFDASRVYLLSSLWLFLVFFILVGVMLFRMKRKHADYMSELPLTDDKAL